MAALRGAALGAEGRACSCHLTCQAPLPLRLQLLLLLSGHTLQRAPGGCQGCSKGCCT